MQKGICKIAVAMCLLASGKSAFAQNASLARAVPANDPAAWVSAADYPSAALDARAQGVVGFALEVDSSGVVTGCAIVSSSGSASLDAQTCALLRERARFTPASGSSAPRSFTSRIRWTLPVEQPPELKPIEVSSMPSTGNGGAELIVGSDGIIKKCQALDRPYWNIPAPPDLCASFPVGTRYSKPTVRKGKPVQSRVRIQITITTSTMSDS